MRRSLLCLSLVLAVSGCSSMKDLFSAHANVAAEAAGRELSADSLASFMLTAKGARLTPETAEFLANLWVDYQLFGQAAANGALKTDSAAVVEVMWPEITDAVGARWHDTLMARRTSFTPAMFDSVYNATDSGAVRVLQHVLVKVDPNGTPAARTAAQRKIAGLLTRARAGADFAALARQNTDDQASKATGGVMNAAPRNAYVTPFDSAGWLLKPGEMSGIVSSPYGYHIIRRPPLAEVQTQIRQWLEYQAGRRFDSLYMDSLGTAKHLDFKSGAAKRLRGALDDVNGNRTSGSALATFDGGKLTVREALRWTGAMPPQMIDQLKTMPDTQVNGFIKALAQNLLFLQDARANGADLTAPEYATLRTGYLASLDTLRGVLGLGASVVDATARASDRENAAAMQVESYFGRLLNRTAPARAIPGPMASYLRDRMAYKINAAGIARAAQLALARHDSAQMATPPSPLPGMNGRTPTPGAQPATPGATAAPAVPPRGSAH